MAERPLQLVVVGHVNAGKTTLIRSLARQPRFGSVAALPASTDRAEPLHQILGDAALAWVDTPGFEDPIALAERFSRLTQAAPAERLKALLVQPEVVVEHAGEWRALGAALEGDAIVLVVDSVELVLPKHRASLDLLRACGRPMVALLNRPAHPAARPDEWAEVLAGHGVMEALRMDAFAPDPAAMRALMRALAGMLVAPYPLAGGLEAAWQADGERRREGGLAIIADTVVSLAARRQTLPRADAADPARRQQAIERFRRGVIEEAEACERLLVAHHGFPPVESGQAPAHLVDGLAGRWEDDLFNAEVLKNAGGKLAGGAALGAAIGLGADVALAGLSLGTGAALGAAVGSIASQGLAPTGRKLLHRVTGQLDLTLEDAALVVLAGRLLAAQEALERRGHGASGAWMRPAGMPVDEAGADGLVQGVTPARGHPEWAAAAGHELDDPVRRKLVARVAGQLTRLLVHGPTVNG
jgi:hypothetical protein